MTTFSLPIAMGIPGLTAATMRFHGDLSARDQSVAFTIAWLAANDLVLARRVGDDLYDIDDHGLRRALAMGKSRSIEDEIRRYERLQWSRIWLDGVDDPVRPPTLASMDDPNPLRAKNLDGSLRWRVDPRLVEAVTLPKGEEGVRVPRHLLRAAKSRYALQLMMRFAAWQAGYGKPEWEHSRNDDALVLRVPTPEILDDLGMDRTIPPSNFIADVLEPAAEDVSRYGDILVEAKPRRTRYRDGRLGKTKDIQIGIYRFENDGFVESFEERVRRIAMERIVAEEERAREAAKPKVFKRPPLSRRKQQARPGVSDTSNVVALTRRAAPQATPIGRAKGFVMPPVMDDE